MHKPTIHTEEETPEDIHTNKTHTEEEIHGHTSQQYIQRKRHIKTYIRTRHKQKEETQEHTQANNTYRGRDT